MQLKLALAALVACSATAVFAVIPSEEGDFLAVHSATDTTAGDLNDAAEPTPVPEEPPCEPEPEPSSYADVDDVESMEEAGPGGSEHAEGSNAAVVAPATTSSSSAGSKSGLGAGAVAGIAVGAAAGVALMGGVGYYVSHRAGSPAEGSSVDVITFSSSNLP